jgi:glycosyltransferase involved in cell wall biosynthesis
MIIKNENHFYMNIQRQRKELLLIWVFQTGEPLHIDGGDARPMRAMNLSNALVGAGHKVVLWSSAFYHQEKRHRSLTAQSIKISDNLEIRLIPSRGYKRNIGLGRLIDHAQLATNLKKMLKQSSDLPDVAFTGFPPIETAAVLTKWLVRHGVPSLLDVKDQWPSLFLDAAPASLRPLGRMILCPYFYLARRAIRDATGLSAMANNFLDWALGIAERRRSDMDGVFPLTSPVGQVSKSQLEEARRWWNEQGILDDGRPRIIFVGSFMSIFDFKPVQEATKIAIQKNAPCEFVICGDGGSSAELRAMMAGLTNVHFPGWIDRPKIEALAERSQAALAPYLNIDNFTKNIPNKIVDALSLGLPIICPLQGEVASLIAEHGVGLRYGTDSGKNLQDCIQILTNDPIIQRSMSLKARALYEERFSFDMVYGGLVKHLEKLAQRTGSK